MALFGKSSIASLEAQAQKAQAELIAAEAAFASAVQSMESPPIELTDDQVGDLVSVKNLAEVRLVQARAGARRAEHALAEARVAAAAKERADSLARVASLGKAAQKVAREELAAAIKGMRRAIRMMAEAEAAREELNPNLPPEERLESFEVAVLCRPGIPEQVVKRERLLKWVNSAGAPLFSPEDEARLVEDRKTGTAKLPPRPGSLDDGNFVATRRRFFERTVTLPEVHPRMEGGLAETISLPGLDGSPAGWTPCRPSVALRQLTELEKMAIVKPPERTPIETIKPVSPVLSSQDEVDRFDRQQAPFADAAE